MTRSRKILLAVGALVVVALGVGALWLFVLRDDAPDALGSDDLDEALATTTAPAANTAATARSTATPATTGAPAGPTASDASGTWSASPDSVLGYRVQEVLGGIDVEAAGRTTAVTGSLTIDGTQATAAEFTVDMASITSDSDRRDNQFRGRIMSVDQFPTATFVLTAPIEFGAVPAEGQPLTATATGDLTLRGTTRSVTFDVEAKLEGGRIGVLGSIPVAFSDYGIPDPSNGFAVVKDNGLLEFVLVFEPI